MTRPAALLAVALLAGAATPALAQPERGDRVLVPIANPSALVSAELAFARLAAERGQWTAFRKTATKDAAMFVPQAVNAQAWLKGRADPPQAVRWQPHAVFIACDGSLGATTGAWQRPDGSQGYFTTLWQRQENGDYRWIVDHGDALTQPRPAPDIIRAQVAECAGPPRYMRVERRRDLKRAADAAARAAQIPVPPPARLEGGSQDGTLRWAWAVEPDGTRRLTVTLRQSGAMAMVIEDRVAAPAPASAPAGATGGRR